MRLLLAVRVGVVELGALADLLVVFTFHFMTRSPRQHYGPELYVGMAQDLLAMLAVASLVFLLLRLRV